MRLSQCDVGDVYQIAENWWLLITAETTDSLVDPQDLRSCLENLRTLTDPEHILCFQVLDFYRGKFDFRHWLELIAIIFCRHPRIRILDHYVHHFDPSQTVVQTLKTIDTWSRANTASRAIQRSVWSDKYAIETVRPAFGPASRQTFHLPGKVKTGSSTLHLL